MNQNTPPAMHPTALEEPNDAATLARIYKAHRLSFIRQLRRTLPIDAAWDVLQKVFCNLLARGNARPVGNLLHFVRRSLSNGAAEWGRQQQRQRQLETRLITDDVLLELPSSESCVAIAEQFSAQIDALSLEQPEALRALVLVKLEGLRAEQAGWQMGKSRYQIMRLVARALLHLESACNEDGWQ